MQQQERQLLGMRWATGDGANSCFNVANQSLLVGRECGVHLLYLNVGRIAPLRCPFAHVDERGGLARGQERIEEQNGGVGAKKHGLCVAVVASKNKKLWSAMLARAVLASSGQKLWQHSEFRLPVTRVVCLL